MRTLHALAATSLLVLGVSAVSHAQQTDTDTQRTMATDDHDTDMGWLGLLGLAGLLGLKRRDRDETIVRRDSTGTTSRP
jgi:MYXO-CTERM domain-containing protein